MVRKKAFSRFALTIAIIIAICTFLVSATVWLTYGFFYSFIPPLILMVIGALGMGVFWKHCPSKKDQKITLSQCSYLWWTDFCMVNILVYGALFIALIASGVYKIFG